jgi:hypothetical protein
MPLRAIAARCLNSDATVLSRLERDGACLGHDVTGLLGQLYLIEELLLQLYLALLVHRLAP